MSDARENITGRLLVLRLKRLGRLPPALHATQILEESGADVVVLEFGNVREADRYPTDGVRRFRWEFPSVEKLPETLHAFVIFAAVFLKLARKIFAGERPAGVVAHGLQEQALALGLNWLFAIDYVVHVHEAYDRADLTPSNWPFLWMEGLALRRATFLVFPGVERREVYRERYCFAHPSYIVYNSPRTLTVPVARDWRTTLGLPPDSFLLGFVGGISRDVGIDIALDALALEPRLQLLVWGWANPDLGDELSERAKKLGVESRYHRLGELRDGKWEALAGCDAGYAVYFPRTLRLKTAATASNKLFEFLALGKPVVTSSAPDFKALVEGGKVGVSAQTLDGKGLVHALGPILDRGALYRVLSENARREHLENHAFDRQFAPVLEAFRAAFPAAFRSLRKIC